MADPIDQVVPGLGVDDAEGRGNNGDNDVIADGREERQKKAAKSRNLRANPS